MIAKGTTHNNGAKLAWYMITGKDGERAELWELRGFEATGIKDAFRDVHIMAEATQCEQPFFHVQVRNPDGEILTRQQWQVTANRIERMLGLTGQPRAIAFHINEATGHEHMHVAWSRIDENTLKAKHLPFFKERLKKVSRELELHFGLTIVKNERAGPIKYAPTRAQEEQARRLNVDIHEVRNTIRACWDHSDCGVSFQAALAHEGLILTLGDRRGLVVVDHAGGVHALGKRILDVTPAKIFERITDLDQLPGVEQAREFILGRQQQPDVLDRLKTELAEVGTLLNAERQRAQETPAPVWDRDRANNDWQEAVINAAIEKEKAERQFVEPGKKETRAGRERGKTGRQEQAWPINPPQPERKSPELFAKAATEAARDDRTENLSGPAAQVWKAWHQSDNAQAYAAALDEKQISFAQVTKEEADRSHREAEFAKAAGNYAPRFKEGEIVIITAPPLEYRRNGEITEPRSRVRKLDQSLAWKFVKGLDNGDKLQGLDATIRASDERVEQRAADRDAIRQDWDTIRQERAASRVRESSMGGKTKGPKTVEKAALAAVIKLPGAALEVTGKTLGILESLFEGIFAAKLTPEQIREGEIAAKERQADVRDQLDNSNSIAQRAQERQQEEQREAARQRERERDGGGRER